MSLPQFPNENMTRDDAINQILSSIAMEELGLSHIINAEGEKLQYILGTLEGSTPTETPTIDQVLQVNESVKDTLDSISANQLLLKGKMSTALSASNMVGPTGPTGPAPVIAIDPVTFDWTIDGVDTGVSAVNGATGATGATGPTGPEPVIAIDPLTNDWTVDGVTTGVSAIGATGPTGPNSPAVITQYNPVDAPNYVAGQLVEDATGTVYVVNNDNPSGTPGVAPNDYTPIVTPCGSILPFSNGPVDWTMPTTWPFVIDAIDLSSLSSQLAPITGFLSDILSLASSGITPITDALLPITTAIDDALSATGIAYIPDVSTLVELLTSFTGAADANPSLSMNAYIGLANVGTTLQAGSTDLPVWTSILAGPPYPIVLPRDGIITSFTAEFDALAAINPNQLLSLIPGLSDLLDAVASLTDLTAVLTPLVVTLNDAITTAQLLDPTLPTITLPSPVTFDTTDPTFATGDTIEMTATLWHSPTIMNPTANVNLDPATGLPVASTLELQGSQGASAAGWVPIAELDLGPIELAHLAAWDSLTSLPGGVLSALESVLGLTGAASTTNLSENGSFASALAVLPTPVSVSAGDYLMVEFRILSSGVAVAVAVAAPNLTASVNITCP